MLLVPHLGLVRSGLMFGLLQLAGRAVGLVAVSRTVADGTLAARSVRGRAGAARRRLRRCRRSDGAGRGASLCRRNRPRRNLAYQRIVITRWKDDLRLFLNNNLQFSARDEYRYHGRWCIQGWPCCPGQSAFSSLAAVTGWPCARS